MPRTACKLTAAKGALYGNNPIRKLHNWTAATGEQQRQQERGGRRSGTAQMQGAQAVGCLLVLAAKLGGGISSALGPALRAGPSPWQSSAPPLTRRSGSPPGSGWPRPTGPGTCPPHSAWPSSCVGQGGEGRQGAVVHGGGGGSRGGRHVRGASTWRPPTTQQAAGRWAGRQPGSRLGWERRGPRQEHGLGLTPAPSPPSRWPPTPPLRRPVAAPSG